MSEFFKLLSKRFEDVEVGHFDLEDLAFEATDLPAVYDALKNLNTGIDDRKLLLEKVLVLMSRLGDASPLSTKLQQSVIDLLYKDLPHPPSGYLRPPTSVAPTIATSASDLVAPQNANYAYRSADGSDYNVLLPSLGKAGTPYARSVPSTNFTPLASLPDSGLLFDTLLRREKFKEHPDGISSLFFAFANLVIHSIFNTDHKDPSINQSSSYLDLSILYGSNAEEVNQVRRKDGTGRLWEDVFADYRLLLMPPSTCALLVLLCRNHNFIAEKILNINEGQNTKEGQNGRRTYHSPPPANEQDRLAQDDEIFNRARLVNCGFFMQIILGDYVGAILGLSRDGYPWRLNPLESIRELNHEVSPRGEGNVVSIEFNLLYRWHATLSEKDTEWTEELFKEVFNGKDLAALTKKDFKDAVHAYYIPLSKEHVKSRTFKKLKRGPDGRFNDGDLAKILLDATEWSAGAYQARGTPVALRIIEVLGIEQSREWGVCSLNEFRKFMGLKPYSSFKEWNPKLEIHTAAEALYKNIENLELHVGLQAEEAKVPGPGAGLCPGYTISRAILADAVCLTRGDRFLTVDFTPFSFTSWGYQDCQYDKEDGSYGGMLTKLLYRTLPNHYPAGSAYAHFPFLVPARFKKTLEEKGRIPVEKYNWERPPVPKGFVTVETYDGVVQVVQDRSKFLAGSDHRINVLTKTDNLDRTLAHKLLFLDNNQKWAKFFASTIDALIKEKSVNHVGSTAKYVDIVKDVINLLPVRWISHEIAGFHLKTPVDSKPRFDEYELYDKFSDVCRYVFVNADSVDDWRLRESGITTFNQLTELYTSHHQYGIFKFLFPHANAEGNELAHRLLSVGGDPAEEDFPLALFAEVVPTAAHFSQALAQVVNFYLDEGRSQAREDIVKLAAMNKPDADAKVIDYVHEALRLDPLMSGVYRTAGADGFVDGTKVQTGDLVFASIAKANLDPKVFGSEPKAAVYARPGKVAGIFDLAEHGLLSPQFFQATVPRILGKILGLKGVQHGPGKSGKFNKFSEDWHGTRRQLYINSRGQVTPLPDSLIIQFTAEGKK